MTALRSSSSIPNEARYGSTTLEPSWVVTRLQPQYQQAWRQKGTCT